jgi:hypothetical protein
MIDDVYKASKSGRYHDGHGYGYHNKSHKNHNILLYIAERLFRSKALIAAAVLIFLTLGAIGIWLLITLLPFLGQLLSILEKQGIKGILDAIAPFLKTIWEGSGK